jgi:Fur family ferric uptake transcriptional regulator
MGKISTDVTMTSARASVEDVLQLVRSQGGRVTHAKRMVLHAFFEDPTHHTVEQLAEMVQREAPEIHLSTIYRNVVELERLGVIVHAHFGHRPTTYHLAGDAHGHLVCEKCEAMIEVPDDLFSGLSRSAVARFGFEVNPHHFAVLGRCGECVAAEIRQCS